MTCEGGVVGSANDDCDGYGNTTSSSVAATCPSAWTNDCEGSIGAKICWVNGQDPAPVVLLLVMPFP